MFELRDALLVSTVVEAGTFRAAAAVLGVAPSAVSARIAQLEDGLGARLFDRSRRGAQPTPAGRRFLEQSQRLLSMRDRIVEDLRGAEGLTGSLRIGVAETVVHTRLTELLRRLAFAAPRVRIELLVDVSENLARGLLANRIDIAMLMPEWTPPDARSAPIERVEIGWFAAESLLRRTPGLEWTEEGEALSLGIEALSELAVITFLKQTTPAKEVDRIVSDPRLSTPMIHGSSSLATMIRLTLDGFGVGTLPVTLVADELADGRLRRLDFGPEAQLSALRFDICHIAPAAAPFIEILTEA